MRKLILLLLLLGFSGSAFAVVCDSTKQLDGKDICVVNVPLDIPQSVIDAGGIDMYAHAHGYPQNVPDPDCTPQPRIECPCVASEATTCTPEEESQGCVPHDAVICDPCTPQSEIVCGMVPNPQSTMEFSKNVIRGQVKSEYISLYKNYVSQQATITAQNQIKSLFPDE